VEYIAKCSHPLLRRRGEITESSGSTGVMDSPVWG
jgi:hypothetical protein